MPKKNILVVGTYDTKHEELNFLKKCIVSQGGGVVTMDVSVIGDANQKCDVTKYDVAKTAGTSIKKIAKLNDENNAMQIMTKGAVALTKKMYEENKISGVIILGGTMGTDLALDVCNALPIGTPKYVVSTVAFSPLIPTNRLAPDIQMILWAGGLYGLNSICKASLSQAAGAVVGAANAVTKINKNLDVVGMTSLGSSCLKYMKILKPELEKRGCEVAIFHATGMGGMAFEKIAKDKGFICVMDFALPEITNLIGKSVVNAGEDRMTNAGKTNIPQIIAPGCVDLIDFAGHQKIPNQFRRRPFHAHNRLIKSAALNGTELKVVAQEIAKRLAKSKAPVHVILPTKGVEEWDKKGQPAYNPKALNMFVSEMKKVIKPPVQMTEINAHINDKKFATTALKIFDSWIQDGTIKMN